MKKTPLLLFLIFFFCLASSHALAQRAVIIKETDRRLALIIGNGDYKSSPLKNPLNDARDMAAMLQQLGFQVIHEENATRKQMDIAIRNFGQKLSSGGTGLFYFAGHGMQVKGRNFLIPVDANIESESDVEHESIDAGKVLGKMEDARNPVNIVILDACRDNPFARSFRSAEKGLARMDAPVGSIIAYATAPGSVAADGKGRNGVYTKYLLDAMVEGNQTIEQVFKMVRNSVITETKSKQIPWESTSLRGDFYFNPGGTKISAQTKQEPITTASLTPVKKVEEQTTGDKYFSMLATRGMDESIRNFEKAVKDDPGAVDERAGLAIGLLLKDKKDQAKYHIMRLKDEGRTTPYTRLALGLYQGSEKNLDDAMYQINRSREEGVDLNLYRLVLASTYKRNEKYQEAIELMKEYKAAVPVSEAIILKPTEIKKDGRFLSYDDGTVLDTKTDLMWAAKDNGSDINWGNAKSYCENYRGGGYTDWRMPTLDDLEGLYDENKPRTVACYNLGKPIHVTTELIDITCYAPWASETRGSDVALFNFIKLTALFRDYGKRQWYPPSHTYTTRALPVRNAK
jgi:hypothetical protein